MVIGDPRPAGDTGPAGDQRAPGETGQAGDPRPAGEQAPSQRQPAPARSAPAAFNPSEHTVDEVHDHLEDADPAERDRVLQAEQAGKARTSILG